MVGEVNLKKKVLSSLMNKCKKKKELNKLSFVHGTKESILFKLATIKR